MRGSKTKPRVKPSASTASSLIWRRRHAHTAATRPSRRPQDSFPYSAHRSLTSPRWRWTRARTAVVSSESRMPRFKCARLIARLQMRNVQKWTRAPKSRVQCRRPTASASNAHASSPASSAMWQNRREPTASATPARGGAVTSSRAGMDGPTPLASKISCSSIEKAKQSMRRELPTNTSGTSAASPSMATFRSGDASGSSSPRPPSGRRSVRRALKCRKRVRRESMRKNQRKTIMKFKILGPRSWLFTP